MQASVDGSHEFAPHRCASESGVHATHAPVVTLHSGVPEWPAQSMSSTQPRQACVPTSHRAADGDSQSDPSSHAMHVWSETLHVGSFALQSVSARHSTQSSVAGSQIGRAL